MTTPSIRNRLCKYFLADGTSFISTLYMYDGLRMGGFALHPGICKHSELPCVTRQHTHICTLQHNDEDTK